MAQAPVSDSSSQQNALNNAVALYNSSIGIQAPLFSGVEYNFHDPHIKGNAYYLDINGFSAGTVYYDGLLYNKVSLLYDLFTDDLVVLLPNRVSKFVAIKERVKWFNYQGGHFININTDTLANNTVLKSGYYLQIYSGRSEVLGRYEKTMQTSTNSTTGVENYFSQTKDFYLRKNNVYYRVNSKGALQDVLKDKKKELKKFMNANNIQYRENPEDALLKIATWYDHLSN
ncbi:MAG TPA: hypothetical protein VIM55_13295 [Mucilaginibacter sp.]